VIARSRARTVCAALVTALLVLVGIGVVWIALALVLARTTRSGAPEGAIGYLDTKTAPWRSLPVNRPANGDVLGVRPGNHRV
jgi:hypothetical protein